MTARRGITRWLFGSLANPDQQNDSERHHMLPRPQPSTGAEAFARMLDGAAEVRSWAVPDLDDLPELVALTRAMGSVQAPAPRPEFAASLRTQLLESDPVVLREPERPIAEAAAEIIDLAASRKRKATRRAYTAAAVGSLVLGSAGIAAAAQSALPGSPLYGVKRGVENLELSFATNDTARGHDLLDQARTRLSEVQQLSKSSDASNTTLIQKTLQAFSTSAAEGTNLLFVSFQRNGNARDLAEIQRFATTSAGQLNSLSPSMIEQNRAQMLEASSLIANVEQQSKMLCPTCAALPPLNEQYQQLSATSNQTSGLNALLATPRMVLLPQASGPVTAPAETAAPTLPKSSQPAKPTTPPQPAPAPQPTNTNALGQTLGAVLTPVLKPVLGTVGGVLQATTGTVGGLLNTLVPPAK